MNIVYISYDSMQESLGKSQVLSYLNLISNKNVNINLISFEKKKNIDNNFLNNKIVWHSLRYHKKFKIFSAFYDVINGFFTVVKIRFKCEINLIHARSYISCLIALLSFYILKIPYVFDMRGLWIDEKIESGTWSGFYYRPVIFFFRFLEKKMLRNASQIVSLTESAKIFLEEKFSIGLHKFEVIPTCVNYSFFFSDSKKRLSIRKSLKLSNGEFLLIFSGSIGGYYRFDYILDFFEELRCHVNSKLLILTKTDIDLLSSEIKLRGLCSNILIKSCSYENVNDYLNAADAGLIIYEKTTSSLARNSTKLGEYWACSLPVFAPGNVGDINNLFKLNNQSHLILEDFNINSYKKAINLFLHLKMDYKMSNYVKMYFDLSTGVEKYMAIYNKIYNS
jgi:glycosyltransferase involved in cell wall biosynthesis